MDVVLRSIAIIIEVALLAGIAYWVDAYLGLREEQKIDKHHPGIVAIAKWVEEQYRQKRTTGISDEEKTRLFEPYFSTKKAGMGLGLTIVSTIIADHKGMLRVQDNQPKGAKFIIELPAQKNAI